MNLLNIGTNFFQETKTLWMMYQIPQLCGLPWLALMMKWRILEFTNKTFLKTFVWKKNIFFP